MEPEQQLIEAAQSDKTQFVTLYDQNFDRIYRFILTRVADRDLAEDLTSETFMKALEKIDTFTWTGKPFHAWLYRIAINEINQYFRWKKKELKLQCAAWREIDSTFEPADMPAKENEEKVAELAQLKEMHGAFRELKPHEQTILALKYFEGLSYKEMADTLGVTVGNVGVKLNRATRRLSELCNFSNP